MLILLLLQSVFLIIESVYENPSNRIWMNISAGYNEDFRPVVKQSTIVNVSISIELYRIVAATEADETITLIQWTHWVVQLDRSLLSNPFRSGSAGIWCGIRKISKASRR